MDNQLKKLKQIRDKKEDKLLKGFKLCYYIAEKSNLDREDLTNKLKQLNTDAAKVHLQRNFTNIELMDAIFCMFDTTFYLSSDGLPEANKTVRKFIDRLHKSKYGFTTTSKDTIDLFSIKTTKFAVSESEKGHEIRSDEKDEQDLLHEFFIASLFTNRLRQFVPNFAYVFGGFKLNTPHSKYGHVDSKDVKICSCDTRQKVDYLIYEKIDGVTMSVALRTCTLEEYLSWTVQLILSLELAVIHFGFTHYNLHTDNVIIRTIKKDSNWAWIQEKGGSKIETKNGKYYYIPYFHQNKSWMVKCTSIATIWNYEFAHVKYKVGDGSSEHFGAIGYNKMGIFDNEARPFYDFYKVMMWSLRILQKHNESVFLEARKVSKFFGYEYSNQLNIALETEERSGSIYNLTISDLERTRSLSDLLVFMNQEFSELNNILILSSEFTKYEKLDVINCEGFCPSVGFNVHKLTGPDALSLFVNLKDVMERYRGLQKRAFEMKRLCHENDYECVNADRELKAFRGMVNRNKYEMREREIQIIDKLTADINNIISVNEIDAKKYIHENGQYKIPPRILVAIYRSNEQAKNMSDILTERLMVLDDFDREFSVRNGRKPKDRMKSIITEIIKNLSQDNIKKLVESKEY